MSEGGAPGDITLDEFGTEAAAVTGIAFASGARAAPPLLCAPTTRPFALAVVERTTHAPLFVGTVANPTA